MLRGHKELKVDEVKKIKRYSIKKQFLNINYICLLQLDRQNDGPSKLDEL